MDGRQGMPVVRCRDQDGVNILPVQQAAVIVAAVEFAVEPRLEVLLRLLDVRFVDVADGDDVLVQRVREEVAPALSADTDDANADGFAGSGGLGGADLAQEGARQGQRGGGAGGQTSGTTQELTTGDTFLLLHGGMLSRFRTGVSMIATRPCLPGRAA